MRRLGSLSVAGLGVALVWACAARAESAWSAFAETGVVEIVTRDADGALRLDHAIAADATHQEVVLPRSALFAFEAGRPTVYSDTWSHQLGGTSARSQQDFAYRRCYGSNDIRPLPDDIAREYRLERRASPASL